ncbi:MAG TPA: nucleotide exchange factor GrpE [Chthonomonadaceae bacterium]|nr:nucleotide exchange factor GrpE [Chthonomonadaceae bacterium]
MRRKIEVTTDEPLDAEGAPELAPDANAPEFGDHVNPPEPVDPMVAHQPEEAAGNGAAPVERAQGEPATAQSRPVDDATSAYITALQADLEEARQQAEEAEKRLLYLQAEFQNFRRRKEEEMASQQRYANSELIKSLLPILDNFERAIAAAEQTKNFDALVGGVTATLRQLQSFLEKAGVKPIEAVGQEFDPRYHEALGHTESEEHPANTVAEEVQRGYVLHDRVLRPALVKVSQG